MVKKKSLESKISALEEKIYKCLSKKKIEKVEKLIPRYNYLVQLMWSAGPSEYPLQKIRCVDKKNAVLKRENKCVFCGSNRKYVEVLPYLFGTIKFIDICKNKECQNAFQNYKKGYLRILSQAHEDLSKYRLYVDK